MNIMKTFLKWILYYQLLNETFKFFPHFYASHISIYSNVLSFFYYYFFFFSFAFWNILAVFFYVLQLLPL